MNKKTIFRLNDQISFRKCTLYDGESVERGDCTNYGESTQYWQTYYSCNQKGIHLHCAEHPEIEFNIERIYDGDIHDGDMLTCPKCNKPIIVKMLNEKTKECLRMLNIEEFKNAKLVRLDDWYVNEIKDKSDASEYWINTNVKTDKDGDTIIIVYVGHKGSDQKAQFFIKPEKCQLTSDHKDLDPAKILSKIEITLKGRTLSHNYDESL